MRRGLWRTGLYGLAGLAALGAFAAADEFSPFQQPRYRYEPAPTSLPSHSFPDRAGFPDRAAAHDLFGEAAGLPVLDASRPAERSRERAPHSTSPVPNYHQELFGTPRPAARPAPRPAAPLARPAAPAAQPVGRPAGVPERLEGRHVYQSRPLREDARAQGARTARSAEPAEAFFPQAVAAADLDDHQQSGGTGRSAPNSLNAEAASETEAAPHARHSADELIPAEFRSDRHQGGVRRILASEFDAPPFRTPAQPEARRSPANPGSGAPLHRAAAPVAAADEGPDVLIPPLPAPPGAPAPFAPAVEGAPLIAARPSALVSPPLPAGSDQGEPQFPAISLKWIKKGEMLVGQECACELIVHNDGQSTAADVIVEAHFPPTVRMLETQPQPVEAETHLVWRFESLAPGAEQTIQLKLIPSRRGSIEPKALVRFTQGATSRFSIDEPLLEVALKGPAEVSLGDPASQIVLVSNPGTGTVRNVTVLAHIPPGLENPNGNKLALDIGSLGPGETRRVRLGLAAARGGRHTVSVEATAASGLRHATKAEVTVISPSLKLDLAGPALRYKGRRATYVITVANDGTAPSNNVRVTHGVPDGFEFVRADAGGFHDGSKRTVEWFIDRIEAGKSQTLSLELVAARLGEFVHHVVATSEQGVRAEQELAAAIEGTASLVLEVVDLDDPVEVGVETGYEIRVRNEGSKPATNVALSCELPQGIELLEAKGPAESSTRDGVISFHPLPALENGKTAIYRVTVRGTTSGQHRFRALLLSDSITRPLAIEELTRVYGD